MKGEGVNTDEPIPRDDQYQPHANHHQTRQHYKSQSSVVQYCHKFSFNILSFLLGIIVNLALIILANVSQTVIDRYGDTFTSYRIFYYSLFIVYMIVGGLLVSRVFGIKRLLCAKEWPNGLKCPNGLEWLFILSCLAPITYNILSCIANFRTPNEVVRTDLTGAKDILNIIEVVAQTYFYFLAKSLVEEFRQFDAQRNAFTTILLLLASSNGTLWVMRSFVLAHHVGTSFQVSYYPNWPFIYNILNPIVLLYRFNSMFMFADIFLKFWNYVDVTPIDVK